MLVTKLPYVAPRLPTATPGDIQPKGYGFARDPLEMLIEKESARDAFFGTDEYFKLVDECCEAADLAASELVSPNSYEYESLNEKLFEQFLELRLKALGL